MNDMSYADAIERANPPRHVILGPAPCHRCGAWVEWAGVEWLALGTDEPHDCAPFLEGQGLCIHGRQGPHSTTGMLPYGDGHCSGPGSWWPAMEVVSDWVRPTTGLRQAHLEPVPWAEPRWMRTLGAAILWVAFFLAAAFAVALVARQVGGGW